jgi:hypothetical protein
MTTQDKTTAGSSSTTDSDVDCDNALGLRSTRKPAQSPSTLVSRALLLSVIEDNSVFKSDGVAIIVIAPGTDFIEPVMKAWHDLAADARGFPDDELMVGNADHVGGPLHADDDDAYYSLWRTEDRREGARVGNDAVAYILSGGKTVIGFSDADNALPSNLVRAADYRIMVPPPDWSAVATAITLYTGCSPTERLTDGFCRKLSVDDINLACRPSEGPDKFVHRLKRLGNSQAPEPTDGAPFLDQVFGMDEAVVWGLDLARDLCQFHTGSLDWADVDRGAVLVGLPGTGKTRFARSLARTCSRECGVEVPLVTGSYAVWQSAGHLGDMIKAMRRTFRQAEAETPSILFIDEIDSFGNRASFSGDHAEYSRNTVNALLECLDGASGRTGVVVVGATNDASRLDPALVRPGRFDRTIPIRLPDRQALVGIFRQHLRGAPVDADLGKAAQLAVGATGAEVEAWCRSARRRARTEGRTLRGDDLLAEIRMMVGAPPSAEALVVRAVHEAGHAFMCATEGPGALGIVSIRAVGNIHGITISEADDVPMTADSVHVRLRRLLAGRAAEIVLLGKPSSGSGGSESSDLAQAASLAVAACSSYGLLDESPRWLGRPSADTAIRIMMTRPDVAKQVERMLDEAHTAAVRAITANRSAVQAIANELRKSETLDGPTVAAIIKRHCSRQATRRAVQSMPDVEASTPT